MEDLGERWPRAGDAAEAVRVAVVGGGWAGLSAAYRLHESGNQVHVYEASRALGGRARTVHSPKLDSSLDNGQHILIGAYTETLALMRKLGRCPDRLFHRMPMRLCAADKSFDFRLAPLPAPFNLVAGLLISKGLRLTERLRLIQLAARLKRSSWMTPSGMTVSEWLRTEQQSALMTERFWEPLCLAALNTPLDQCCAQLLANVLRDSLGGNAHACDFLLPQVGLSTLWPEHLPNAVAIHRGHAVRQLHLTEHAVHVDGARYDAVVVATNVPSALRLCSALPPSDAAHTFRQNLEQLEYVPIATLTLELQTPWPISAPMLMLRDQPHKHHFGQWLFNPAAFSHADQRSPFVHIVMSNAKGLQHLPQETIVRGVLDQLNEQMRGLPPLPSVVNHELIVEKRATFAARPGLQRPANRTPWERVRVAGDWTDTGYPAVLEGAVRSGLSAAASLQSGPLPQG